MSGHQHNSQHHHHFPSLDHHGQHLGYPPAPIPSPQYAHYPPVSAPPMYPLAHHQHHHRPEPMALANIITTDTRHQPGLPSPHHVMPASMSMPMAMPTSMSLPPLPPPAVTLPSSTPIPSNALANTEMMGQRTLPLPPGSHNAQKEIKRRTKTGCLTCRRRRIKCDEGRPSCRNCHKARRDCGYDAPLKSHSPPRYPPPGPRHSPSHLAALLPNTANEEAWQARIHGHHHPPTMMGTLPHIEGGSVQSSVHLSPISPSDSWHSGRSSSRPTLSRPPSMRFAETESDPVHLDSSPAHPYQRQLSGVDYQHRGSTLQTS